jgi:ribose transport system substrate-binding protein
MRADAPSRTGRGVTVAVVLAAALATSCSSARREASRDDGAATRIRLGVSLDLFNETRRAELESIEVAARGHGATVTVVVANNSADEQRDQISQLLDAGQVDALLVIARDDQRIVASIRQANRAGVPVVAMDRAPAAGGDVAFQITGDPQAEGALAARFMISRATPLRVLHLVGSLSDDNAVGRRDGFNRAIAGSRVSVAAQVNTDGDPETAGTATTDALRRIPGLSAIFVPSDFLLPAITQSIRKAGRNRPPGTRGRIVVVTVDGDPVGCRALQIGLIDADVVTMVDRIGEGAVEAAVAAVRGEPIRPGVERVAPLLLTRATLAADGHRLWGCRNL